MHKTAIEFAVKHHITLGRMENGFYYIGHGKLQVVSYDTTAKSALALMRKFRALPIETQWDIVFGGAK